MALTQEQVNALLAPLNPARVRQVQGNAHLEAWDVRRWLLRIFGWGGWDFTVQDCTLIQQIDIPPTDPKGKVRYTVVYRVIGRLTIKDIHGQVLAVFEDGATGDAQNQPSLGDAHDMALKTAMSQALKRCAMNLGDAYGLGLYDGGKTAAVVGKSVAHPNSDEHDAREGVTGGELPNPEPPPAAPAPPPISHAPGQPGAPGPADGLPSPEAQVGEFRARAIDLMSKPRKDALIGFARLKAEIAKADLAGAATTTPMGRDISLGGLCDEALDFVSKQQQGNAHADAAAGEQIEVPA